MPFLTALLIIGLAELGDKTQLLTMTLATRYSLRQVVLGVSCAAAAAMVIAVFLGRIIFDIIAPFYIKLLAGMLFILFGLISFREKEEEEKIEGKKDWSPFVIIFFSFFLAELGDKTQLATLALAADYGRPVQIWLGATLGMIIVNCIGAFTGKVMGKYIPENYIRYLGGAAFVLFGIFTLLEAFL